MTAETLPKPAARQLCMLHQGPSGINFSSVGSGSICSQHMCRLEFGQGGAPPFVRPMARSAGTHMTSTPGLAPQQLSWPLAWSEESGWPDGHAPGSLARTRVDRDDRLPLPRARRRRGLMPWLIAMHRGTPAPVAAPTETPVVTGSTDSCAIRCPSRCSPSSARRRYSAAGDWCSTPRSS